MQPVGRPLVGSQYLDTTMESAKDKISRQVVLVVAVVIVVVGAIPN